jgi:hypothetical protein
MSAIKHLAIATFALTVSISVSACSSTLAPEDDSTTEYVFQTANGADQVVAKDDKGQASAIDHED